MPESRFSMPPSLPDTGDALGDGLIWAIRCVPGEKPVALSSEEISLRLEGNISDQPGWCWLHFDVVHTISRSRINEIPCLPEDVRQILTGNDRGVRLESEDDIVFGALPAFEEANSDEEREVGIWRFVTFPDLLITTRRHPIPSLGVVYRELQRRQVPPNPARLVDRVLLEFADIARRDLARQDDQLDRAEDVLLMLDRDTDLRRVGALVGQVRRRSTELRRIVSPVSRILHDEELELPEWAEEDISDRSQRQIHAALDDLLALQDRARSLQDELTSNQTEETNRRLYIVSVGTTLMLPATFVTGFFGMNTGGMFLSDGPWDTIYAGEICFMIMLGTWGVLKLTKLL
ncbi:MAG: magnesium transporter [Acetobacter sp.]|jgi:zinc transporter|nr:magnesium transporter [Acetobacter sp.]MCH4061458.1 magnesium transporter [Acetobacter sp.]MCI1294090.1 magnesium transporter [Acetobacter sp.]MCI1320691.1 magnesium transporter [Acetobacter sp.]MCI1373991.1 magnesium transporter [Acetobacter sp.]